jgi:hypothetical protein
MKSSLEALKIIIRKELTMLEETKIDYMSNDDVLNTIHTVKSYLDRTGSYMSSTDDLIEHLKLLNSCRRFLDKKHFTEPELELYYEVESQIDQRLEQYATHEQEKDFYGY